ncbi:alginate export family protein [Pseudomonas sp. LAIL14HWK12:I7]|uniref:alginate export family protein n=1 Tax=Pseudomonas sp. LAIL14HWK12:I7 TaxID=1259801 RepID=UPI0004258916|nr:alginate export family protein [Pseudomonas sp. LAIL14HWK12:I7]
MYQLDKLRVTDLRCSVIVSVLITGAVIPQLACADVEFNDGPLSVEASLEVGGAALSTKGVNFGAGQIDFRDGRNHGDSADWFEAFVKPKLEAKYKVDDDFDVYAVGSVISAYTGGDGDAGGYTRSGDGRTSWEDLYVGVTYREWSLSGGRQSYVVGNGFIIADGHLGMLSDGAYWADPRRAFEETVILKYAGDNGLSGQLFTVSADKYLGHQRLTGLNVDYDFSLGRAGATYVNVSNVDNDTQAVAPKNGMSVYDLRLLSAKVPGLPDLLLDGEYAIQRGKGEGIEFDSDAWYLQAAYNFSQLPFTPQLTYRYAKFSGDSDPLDKKRKSWDPLAKGYMDRGAWVIGDITGNYLLNNSNEVVSMWKIAVPVQSTLSVGAVFYDFDLDEGNYYGTPVGSKDFADETALFADWTPVVNTYLTLSYNFVKPQAAAKEVFGGKNFSAWQFYMTYKF